MIDRNQGIRRSPTHLLHQAEQAAGKVFAASALGPTTPRQLEILIAVPENEGLNRTDVVKRIVTAGTTTATATTTPTITGTPATAFPGFGTATTIITGIATIIITATTSTTTVIMATMAVTVITGAIAGGMVAPPLKSRPRATVEVSDPPGPFSAGGLSRTPWAVWPSRCASVRDGPLDVPSFGATLRKCSDHG
jgi:hypothetical protein